ncbi:amidase family protein [Rhodospirillaceae bacterium SYSU D60014]|uniref:amidase n=1 Tax=Virgifigura deserti TaxID=2268457 RepID=UPI000E671350
MDRASELTALTAQQAVALLRRGELSPLELIDAAAARIEATDGTLNALPTLCLDRARDRVRRLTAVQSDPSPAGWLAGLPLAVKDLNDVAGVRTTYGSPIYADHVPDRSDIMVETLEANGGIVLAKSNTPEFGAGANTFNEVFGETRNPWNTDLTCGGSSGGAAAALASGQVWLATGSDLGGSLRTPASFCAVVGLRPSPGRVATGPQDRPFGTLSVEGPMGRTVGDVALMLDAMAGWHLEDPLSLPAPVESFQSAAASRRLPRRIGFSADLGISPVDAEVRAICAAALRRFEAAGVVVDDACPDFGDAPEIFQVLRAMGFVAGLGPLYDAHRDRLKPDVIWNIEEGLALTSDRIGRAERARGALYHRMAAFFSTHDLLACPAACVPPFDVKTRWVRAVEGTVFDNYIDWLRLSSAITLTSCPAISVPCGFTADGRPVGLQLVGRPRGEAPLLAAAAAFEEIADPAGLVPIEPRSEPRPAGS